MGGVEFVFAAGKRVADNSVLVRRDTADEEIMTFASWSKSPEGRASRNANDDYQQYLHDRSNDPLRWVTVMVPSSQDSPALDGTPNPPPPRGMVGGRLGHDRFFRVDLENGTIIQVSRRRKFFSVMTKVQPPCHWRCVTTIRRLFVCCKAERRKSPGIEDDRMINTCPIRFLLILATLFAPIYSLADVAPDPLSKGMTPTRKESRVQMVSQAVVIDLDRKWCRVEADFVLLNRSRSPAIMEVGFPMDIMGHAFCPRRAGGSPGQPLGQAPEES